jgi:DNA-binding transcriptional regulator YiaG
MPTAKQIREIREALKLTQTEAGERVGVTQRAWAHWESGDRTPSNSAALLIWLLKEKTI